MILLIFVDSTELWAAVLFFLFSIGFIFRIFNFFSSWIQRNYVRQKPNVVVPVIQIPRTLFRRPKLDENIIYDIMRLRSQIPKKLTARNHIRLKLKQKPPTPLPLEREPHDIFDTLGNCLLLTYSMLLVVSLPRLPRGWPERLLTGCYWSYCITIVVTYRASLTAILANPAPRLTIDTLDELANSPIGYGAWGEKNKEFFLSSTDESSQKIGSKLESVNDPVLAVGALPWFFLPLNIFSFPLSFLHNSWNALAKENFLILKMNISCVSYIRNTIRPTSKRNCT